ncbi:MAG: hypothetical protein AAFX46_11585 [Cyanobacteria bacterium J06636_27]
MIVPVPLTLPVRINAIPPPAEPLLAKPLGGPLNEEPSLVVPAPPPPPSVKRLLVAGKSAPPKPPINTWESKVLPPKPPAPPFPPPPPPEFSPLGNLNTPRGSPSVPPPPAFPGAPRPDAPSG